jgi:hypothetical protein
MAHTLDTFARLPSAANTTATTNPQTGTYTTGTGATVLVLMLLYAGGTARAGGDPSFNGVTMLQAGSTRTGTPSPEASCEIWYLLDPSIGAFTVSVPNSGGLALKIHIASAIAGGGMVSALDQTGGAGTAGTNPTASVTTTVNGAAIFACVADGAQTWNPSGRSGTQIYDEDFGSWGGGSQYIMQASFGTQAMSWTFGTSEDYGLAVAAFKEVTAPVGHPSKRRFGLVNYTFLDPVGVKGVLLY